MAKKENPKYLYQIDFTCDKKIDIGAMEKDLLSKSDTIESIGIKRLPYTTEKEE